MLSYIVRRLVLIIPTLIIVSIIVFISIRLIPGSVIDQMVMDHAGGQDVATVTESDINPEAIKHALGIDMPFHIQYGRWIGNIFLHGNLGESLWAKTNVTQSLRQRIPVTFELGALAFIIAQMIAIPAAVYSALRQDTWIDYVARSFAIIGLALPNF
jgi:peptide/nickel transport system permease protein